MSNRKRIMVNHAAKPLTGRALAAAEGRTVFVKARIQPRINPDGLLALRKSSNEKLGKKITKGWAKGMPIYTLTLEERKTCPDTCHHWEDCFGNNMMFAQRIAHGEALEAAIEADVATLAAKHPGGFMVRLHILGDFYSEAYVQAWANLLRTHKKLHIYGYTARHAGDGSIGDMIQALAKKYTRRFMMRQSGLAGRMGAVSAEADNAAGAVICPEQTGKVADCASCGLCWTMEKAVAFMTH